MAVLRSGAGGHSSDINLWRIPLGFSLANLVLFGLAMIPDVLDSRGVIHIPEWFSMGGIDDARAILSAMLGCVSTVLVLIFSVALLVLSMAATLFGPRLLYRFLQDRVTQATIGLFMATFIYLCLVILVTHSDSHSTHTVSRDCACPRGPTRSNGASRDRALAGSNNSTDVKGGNYESAPAAQIDSGSAQALLTHTIGAKKSAKAGSIFIDEPCRQSIGFGRCPTGPSFFRGDHAQAC